ncbi:DUF6252 family protein [Hymenobacter sp. ASUV-10]|uniref:DUF6252 family protein n=1 Tax=Hymenobacter aranciens TaxID=3063996 RepID=A0ABT9BJN1_9BACT|nr:DUF6252 family protein [Hymenobacter sp. ASUV-10]MDO7877212.1 DUF6252 family protein [Hymenobacter sp. ASUV-10]
MKTFCTLCLSVLFLVGCGKKDSDSPTPDPNPTGNSFIKATVAGSPAFDATGDIGVVNGTRLSSSDPEDAPARLVLRGTMSQGSIIIITLIKFNGAGTYLLKADYDATIGTSLASYSENGLGGPFYYSQYMPNAGTTVGQVVVTSYDAAAKRIQGTFSFTGSTLPPSGQTATTKQLTNGTFDVHDLIFF